VSAAPQARRSGLGVARWLLVLRFEEVAVLLGLGLFLVLEQLQIARLDLWTQFFREGLRFYVGLAGGVVAVEGLRRGLGAWRRGDRGAALLRGLAPQLLGVAARFLRDWAPFVLLLTLYENLIWLVARLNPRLYDAALQQLDDWLSWGHSTFWLERFVTPGRTEWFSLFYNALFLYPVLVGGILYLLRRYTAYRTWVLTFSLAGYLGFVGYLLVPVVGPTYHYSQVYQVELDGRPSNPELALLQPSAPASAGAAASLDFYRLARQLNSPRSRGREIPRNCFPSLHTAWGLLILAFCFRHLRPLFWVVLFPVLNLIVATVYLRFHYYTDLLAGLALCGLTLTLVPLLLRLEAAARAWAGGGEPAALPPWPRARRLALGLGGPALFFVAVGTYLGQAEPSEVMPALQEELRVAHLLAVLPPGLTRPLGAQFGDALVLEAADVQREELLPGESLRVDLYWRSLRPLGPQWKIFVHFEGPRGRANRDHHPVLGLTRLGDLPAGMVLRDPMVLPAEALLGDGTLKVWVGVFDEQQVERRLPLLNPEGVPNDGRQRVLAAQVRLTQRLLGPRRQTVPPFVGAVRLDGALDEPGWGQQLPAFDLVGPRGERVPGAALSQVLLRSSPAGLLVGVPLGAGGPPGGLRLRWSTGPSVELSWGEGGPAGAPAMSAGATAAEALIPWARLGGAPPAGEALSLELEAEVRGGAVLRWSPEAGGTVALSR